MRAQQLNTRRIIRSFYRSWWKRPLWLITSLVIVPLIVGRLALNPLLERAVRRHLDATKDIAAATFTELDVFLFPPSFTFRDVVVRGPSGETLDIDRLEIHLSSLRELRGAVPHVQARLVHPRLRSAVGSAGASDGGDLYRWLAAMPASRVDLTTVVKGDLGHAASGDGRALLQGLTGEIEGLATGAALRPGPATANGGAGYAWQVRLDGRLDGTDPFQTIFQVAADGSWQASIAVKQVDSAGPPTGAGSVAVEVKAKGKGAQARAAVGMTWSGPEAPVALAQDRLNRLSTKWPAANLVVSELKAGGVGEVGEVGQVGQLGQPAPTGDAPPAPLPPPPGSSSRQSLDLIVVSTPDTTPTASLNPFAAVGLGLDMLRLGNQALLPPPAGVALLGSAQDEGSSQTTAPPPSEPAPPPPLQPAQSDESR